MTKAHSLFGQPFGSTDGSITHSLIDTYESMSVKELEENIKKGIIYNSVSDLPKHITNAHITLLKDKRILLSEK